MIQGIGRLVSQYVHERNQARKAPATPPLLDLATAPPRPGAAPSPGSRCDGEAGRGCGTPIGAEVEAGYSPDAIARFEAWKARHGYVAPAPAPPMVPASPTPIEPI